MGAVPSTPRWGSSSSSASRPLDTVEYLISTFIGDESFPLSSDFWNKLLQLPLNLHWQPDRVHQACQTLAQNNYRTRHLAKILIHMARCLQESISTSSGAPSIVYMKAVNAVYISSIFLKYFIENAKDEKIEELHLSLDESEPMPTDITKDLNTQEFVMHSVLSFIGSIDVSPDTYLLHLELLNFMLVAMSTQLLSGPSPGPEDVNPFIDAAMSQESSLVLLVVRRLLLSYISGPSISLNSASYSVYSEGSQPGVLQRVGSAAANFMLLPFNFLVSSSGEGSRSLLADCSLHVLLILIHYHKCVEGIEPITDKSNDTTASDSLLKGSTHFSDNPYCKALEHATDVEFDRADTEGNVHVGPVLRLPFASLFDALGMYLADEAAALLLYSLLQGNAGFLEYVLVRTDLDTLLMPILEALYNASKRTSNQIYMLLIILLILSQDSSFNASIHKLILPSVPWYKERLLHQTSLGCLSPYNLSGNFGKHGTSCPPFECILIPEIAEMRDNQMRLAKGNSFEGNGLADDTSTEMHIYTDFLRLVLEILNAILTYALPRNPEVVYAIMHRQEVFQPFRNHPRFSELLENIYTVLDFFNSRMDAQNTDGEWSVEKVLQVIIINCRSWRGEGMKMFTQLRFTYEQESHPEEFFIPYLWQLVLSRCTLGFNPRSINLFTVDPPSEKQSDYEVESSDHVNGESAKQAVFLDP
ncbi:hypothetical protein C1H46_015237 [Malus baccata]|uniref:Dymeclin n=1 Tax=Malus baccata TaxID=106549 RepID=A0A540MK05_MALBA|nr:hypothetical protein C1H46_015237 [Malus baccata]